MAVITIKQLEAFVEVTDLGSFRRAAERLATTQPNISARIAGLEGQMGVKLMERDAGSVRLTPKGETLLAHARQVLRAVDGMVAAADDGALFEGVMRLGVTEMIVHSWLGPYLKAVKRRFPNVLVDLTVDLSANLSTALFNRSIDLALQSGPFNRQTAGAVDLGSYSMIWVASPELGMGDRVLSLRDIAQHPVLTHARGTLPFEQLSKHIAGAREFSVRLVPSTNMAACLQMTIDGLGIACLPESMVRNELRERRLVPLRYLWLPDALSFCARYDAGNSASYVEQAALLAGELSARSVMEGGIDPNK